MELFRRAGQQEIQRAQAQHREHVRGEHDERVGGDGEDRRDRIDREDDVGDRDHHQHDEQRRVLTAPALAQPQRFAVVAPHHREAPGEPAQYRVLVHVRFLAGGPEHLRAGDQQEDAEDVEDPVELRDQRGADEDQDAAQHDRAQHAQDQHPLLRLRRHREIGEQHQEDEDVVDRQGLFDQVAGKEFQRDAVGVLRRHLALQVPPQADVEDHGQADPGQRPDHRFTRADLVRAVLPEHQQVDGERDQDQDREDGPHERGADGFQEKFSEAWPVVRATTSRSGTERHSPWAGEGLARRPWACLPDRGFGRGSGPVMTISAAGATPLLWADSVMPG